MDPERAEAAQVLAALGLVTVGHISKYKSLPAPDNVIGIVGLWLVISGVSMFGGAPARFMSKIGILVLVTIAIKQLGNVFDGIQGASLTTAAGVTPTQAATQAGGVISAAGAQVTAAGRRLANPQGSPTSSGSAAAMYGSTYISHPGAAQAQ